MTVRSEVRFSQFKLHWWQPPGLESPPMTTPRETLDHLYLALRQAEAAMDPGRDRPLVERVTEAGIWLELASHWKELVTLNASLEEVAKHEAQKFYEEKETAKR